MPNWIGHRKRSAEYRFLAIREPLRDPPFHGLVWCLTNTLMKMRGHFGRRQGAMTCRGGFQTRPCGRYHARKSNAAALRLRFATLRMRGAKRTRRFVSVFVRHHTRPGLLPLIHRDSARSPTPSLVLLSLKTAPNSVKHRQHPPALDPRPTHDPRLTPPWLSTLYRCPQMPPPHVLVVDFSSISDCFRRTPVLANSSSVSGDVTLFRRLLAVRFQLTGDLGVCVALLPEMSAKECFIVLAFPMGLCYRFSGIAEAGREGIEIS